MDRTIAHRGPDDAATWYDQSSGVGLVHRRLSILDLSVAGRQPMWDAARTACIVYSGETYNFRELRRGLEQSGVRFRSRTDTEVLLQLYLLEGESMLARLNGMFAFAIWDSRSKSLLLARDGLGVKPLYIAEIPRGVLFASELKAIMAEPSVPETIDDAAIVDHLRYLWSPSPRTVFAAVRKIEPGCAVRVRDGRIVRRWRFFDLPFGDERETYSEREAIERLKETLDNAVQAQLVSDRPVGAFLSGGLDSSAVVESAQRQAGRELTCFTIRVVDGDLRREGFTDDLPYARKVAATLGVKLVEVPIGPEIVRELECMVWHLDEPQADVAPLNVLAIASAARDLGIPVLLSGAGGDDIFSGYRRHVGMRIDTLLRVLPPPLWRGLAATSQQISSRFAVGRRARRLLGRPGESPEDRTLGFFEWTPPDVVTGLLAPNVRERAATQPDVLRASYRALSNSMSVLEKMLYLDARFFLPDHNLNYTDKMSMARGIEVRVPLLDKAMVSFAAGLPDRLRVRRGTAKYILRRSMSARLPREVVSRGKSGFGVPLRSWLNGPLRPWLEDALSAESLRRRGLFDAPGTRALVAADRAGELDASYTMLAMVNTELWCRRFIDRRAEYRLSENDGLPCTKST